jgi:glycosyltransferase involved in cell wall biosynthesis
VKRKILILASWYPSAASPVGGIFIHDQAVALSREYDVAVLAPRLVGWREIFKKKIRAAPGFEQTAGLPVYGDQVFSPVPGALARAYPRWVRAARRGFVQSLKFWGKPDLIHAHVVLPGGWAAVKLGRQYAIPVVLTEHSSPFSIHLKTEYQRRWVRDTLAQANHIVAVSPALAKTIRDFHDGIEIDIVGNLIKTQFFVPAASSENASSLSQIRFLSIALLTKQKGMSHLLQAARLLVQRGVSSFELVIGGDGPERAELERMVKLLDLSNHCRFLGLLAPQEVRHWMQHSDVLVMPSLHETFCIVLGEAMSCGKPVIATRCGGPEFVVAPETGILVEVANVEALANAMHDFILRKAKFDPARVRQSVIARFGEEAFLRQISAIYARVWSKLR